MPTPDPQPYAATEDQSPARHRKRKRKALACSTCRRRKLKCDQSLPACGRCLKSGTAACSYESDDGLDDASAAENGPQRNRIHSRPRSDINRHSSVILQPKESPSAGLVPSNAPPRRANINERDVTTSVLRNEGSTIPGPGTSSQRPETMLFKGREFATESYGATSPISSLMHFSALRSFMAGAIEESATFAHLDKDMKTLRRKIKPKRGQETVITDAYILGLLLSKDTSASLAKLYFDRFETTYRILHGPRFWKDFEKLWDDQAEPNLAFTVVLLLVILIARTIAPAELLTYVGSSSSTLEPAAVIHAGKIWLARQSKKHLKAESFQIQILLYVASQINYEQMKQSWNTTGMLVRSAMSAGLHREPSLLGSKISTYNQEMRRRLWLTIVELDLQASVDRGMQASMTGIPWDSRPPGNIDDEDFSEETQQLPPPRSSLRYTSSSYLNLSQRSVRLRTEINSVLNNPGRILSHDQVLDFEDEIVKILEDLPDWEVSSSSNSNSSAPRSSKLALEIQLRQYLLLIHSHYLKQSNIGSRGRYSAMACLNAAVSILRGYKELGSSGFLVHSLLSCGVLRAAISICQTIYSSPKILGELFPSDSDTTYLQSMNEALDLLQHNVTRVGAGFKDYWFVSAAYTLLQLRSSTDKQLRRERQRAAWEKVGVLYYRALASHKDLTAEKDVVVVEMRGKRRAVDEISRRAFPGTTLSGQNPNAMTGLSNSAPADTLQDFALQSIPQGLLFNMEDMSQWTLETGWDVDLTSF